MKGFSEYLQGLQYRPSSISNILRNARRFTQWLDGENLTAGQCTYSDLLSLVKHFREQNYSIHNINCHIGGIQHYLEYQRQQGKASHNPAVNLRVKGTREQLPSDLLSRHQIEQIYEQYQPETPVQKRNKIILGLLVNQALVREELQNLEPRDINLQKGNIRIRKAIRLQERTLKLSASQILPLQEYINDVRPALLKLKCQESEKLLITIGESQHIKETMRELLNGLQKKHPFLRSFIQIRTSMISIWIKERNIREVQYMAGHNSILNTQRYVRANLDELKNQLDLFHPLR